MTRAAAALSTVPNAADAASEAARAARERLGGATPDLALLFLTAEHGDRAEDAVTAATTELEPAHLVGCVAQGVVAGPREVEEGPGAAVWTASLPGARVEPFHATALETDEAYEIRGIPDELADAALVVLLVDPFSFPAAPLLARLNVERPGLPVVGGLAAAGGEPGSQALFVDGGVHPEGAVGAVVAGARVRPLVSQGCAPIGRDAVVTAAEGNVVYELAGQPALERLKEEIATLSPHEQGLAARGLLAGLVIDENRPAYDRGDYLMRGLLGADEDSGAIAIGEPVRVGQTLRFHVRDAESADRDLRDALAGLDGERVAGTLLFTCNGRGTNMFATPDHDARVVSDALGSDALAGFFCGGEIGPVGGRAFLHGFTATLAVFLED
jgi:small ligand-binding sensory domain FIST